MSLRSFFQHWVHHDSLMRGQLQQHEQQLLRLRGDVQQQRFYHRADLMREKVMTTTESGVSFDTLCEAPVVVSLTTFGVRIHGVYLTIESIMQGTVKPNRIILWLCRDEFEGKMLPLMLQKQMARGLEIKYCEDIRSYKKIVPVMEQYPDAVIVTIDDDLIYEYDLLEHLLASHKDNPEAICASRIKRIRLGGKGEVYSYLSWNLYNPSDDSRLNFLTSGGGTLFPTQCFCKEFFNKDAFVSLAPMADDIWINAMAWMSERRVIKAFTSNRYGNDFVENDEIQVESLGASNINPNHCANDEQIKAVWGHYDLYHYLRS